MNIVQTDEPTPTRPLRVWPGVVAVVIQWLAWLVVPMVSSGFVAGVTAVIGELIGAIAVFVWWMFFSRAPRSERFGAVVLMIGALLVISRIIHVSIRTGMMGLMFPVYAIPVLCLAFVLWAVFSRHLTTGPRRASMVATILLACGAWTLVRSNGINGDGDPDFAWRWSETAEQRLLAQTVSTPTPLPAVGEPEKSAEATPTPSVSPSPSAAPEKEASWPGFRGLKRDGVVRGTHIKTDWSASPPVALWRRPIGPGWSSFAVHGNRAYTQEQRGEDEIVACYSLTTGEELWKHRDSARFWESNAGAGPRATPTLGNGRVYTFGATGILNALDARTGARVWSRNVASDTGVKIPGWGFASSPLLVGNLVIVAASGKLVAYDIANGTQRWLGPAGGSGYSSPHFVTIDGVAQIVLLNGNGAISVSPADGTLLWEHQWPGDGIVQPAFTADGDVLIGTGTGMGTGAGIGMRRIAVGRGEKGWTVEERWTSIAIKPYYNDFVVHNGHAFGFDGSILACIDVEDGKRKWRGDATAMASLSFWPIRTCFLCYLKRANWRLWRQNQANSQNSPVFEQSRAKPGTTRCS
jgi:outer membrane protein assembly factor BamB